MDDFFCQNAFRAETRKVHLLLIIVKTNGLSHCSLLFWSFLLEIVWVAWVSLGINSWLSVAARTLLQCTFCIFVAMNKFCLDMVTLLRHRHSASVLFKKRNEILLRQLFRTKFCPDIGHSAHILFRKIINCCSYQAFVFSAPILLENSLSVLSAYVRGRQKSPTAWNSTAVELKTVKKFCLVLADIYNANRKISLALAGPLVGIWINTC